MNIRKFIKKCFVVLLVVGFLANQNIVNALAFAINLNKDPIVESYDDTSFEVEPVELTYLRERNLKVYLKPDNTLEYVYYDKDVHFFDGEKFVDFENNITDEDNSYRTSNQQYTAIYPKEISYNEFVLSHGEYSLSWMYENVDADANLKTNDSVVYMESLMIRPTSTLTFARIF